ncbi:elongation factor protein 1 [Culex quinquefasciatus]|uniref:Elongation factor protein 1 n=1 Tax=Culex quinquefasciatus TaxID=7176 RepID=B0XHY7_CULQU|nr:elongation factor protein 1 [Culex quinquefasciatus]|eukprot:XP_001869259.1 elongation factor protein 1 [Culex quinquefasciatus]
MLHLIFYDHGVPAAIVSKGIILNAAIFGAICLAARAILAVSRFFLLEVAAVNFALGLSYGGLNCDQNAQLMVHSLKIYPTEDCTFFQVLARNMSGTLHAGQEVRMLGVNYSLVGEEDSRTLRVGRVVETSSPNCFAKTANQMNDDCKTAGEGPGRGRGEFFQVNYDWELLASRSIKIEHHQTSHHSPNILLMARCSSKRTIPCSAPSKTPSWKSFSRVRVMVHSARNPFGTLSSKLSTNSSPRKRSTAEPHPSSWNRISSSKCKPPPIAFPPCTPPLAGDVATSPLTHPSPVPRHRFVRLETDLRTHTQGQVFCLSVFHHWQIVPGDPQEHRHQPVG